MDVEGTRSRKKQCGSMLSATVASPCQTLRELLAGDHAIIAQPGTAHANTGL